jgi:sialic acid synthase SpsE
VLAATALVGAAAVGACVERHHSLWRRRDGLRRSDAVARVEFTAHELRAVVRAIDLVVDVLRRDVYQLVATTDRPVPLVVAREVMTAAAEQAGVDMADPFITAMRDCVEED